MEAASENQQDATVTPSSPKSSPAPEPALASSNALDSNALLLAIEEGNVAEVEKLVGQFGTGLAPNGFNILMYAAANKKGAAVVQALLATPRFDINTRSTGKVFNFSWNEEYVLDGHVDERFGEEIIAFDEGLTAIQLSALSGSLQSFNELLRAGASLGPDTAEGRTVQQLISLRYEPGGADSKRVLAKALLDRKSDESAEVKTVAVPVTTPSEAAPAESESSKVVFHLPTESESKKVDVPLCSFSVQGQTGAIPQIGFGTALMPKSAIKSALKLGVRHLDGALRYCNQEELGQALAESGVPREEVFITSKVSFFPAPGVWMYDEKNMKGQEAQDIDLCLKQLNVSQIDLMLLHNGIASAAEYNASMAPHMFELFASQGSPDAVKPDSLPGGVCVREAVLVGLRELARQSRAQDPAKAAKEAKTLRANAWKALEEAQKAGKVKYIGVANYPVELLEEMKDYATVLPCVDQVELHPRFSQAKLQKYCRDAGIALVAYGSTNSVRIEKSPVVAEIASRVNKSPSQVVLKWSTQLGLAVIPAAKSEAHVKENLDLFDFTLLEEDMAKLNAMNQDHPYYWDPKPTQDTVR